MSNVWTYEVFHYTRSDSFLTSNDISGDLIGIPLFTDTGTGVFNSAVILISIPDGKYISKTPIIDDFDRIRIKATDYEGNEYNSVYDVIRRTPIKDETIGTRMQITLLGIEHWLDKFSFSQPGFFKSSLDMANLLFNQYQESRALHNPFILNTTGTGVGTIDFPSYTTNIYDFGIGPEKIYSRLIDLADKLGGSVENGGVLDYFDIRPNYDPNSVNIMTIEGFSSGNPIKTTGNEVVVDDTLYPAISNVRGYLYVIKGTVINVLGGAITGNMLTVDSNFRRA